MAGGNRNCGSRAACGIGRSSTATSRRRFTQNLPSGGRIRHVSIRMTRIGRGNAKAQLATLHSCLGLLHDGYYH